MINYENAMHNIQNIWFNVIGVFGGLVFYKLVAKHIIVFILYFNMCLILNMKTFFWIVDKNSNGVYVYRYNCIDKSEI